MFGLVARFLLRSASSTTINKIKEHNLDVTGGRRKRRKRGRGGGEGERKWGMWGMEKRRQRVIVKRLGEVGGGRENVN